MKHHWRYRLKLHENIHMNIQAMGHKATSWIHVAHDPFPGPCIYSNESAVSIKCGEFN
jgi:hypothetical protein